MSEQNHSIYEFGPFRLDARKRLLKRNGEVVPLKPKAFDTLLALVEGSGRIVEKDELMKRVWGDVVVEEGNLTFNISSLRKALGERPNQHEYIVTIPGEGYRFVAGVRAGFDEVEVRERTRVTIEREEETEEQIAIQSVLLPEPNGPRPFMIAGRQEPLNVPTQTEPALISRPVTRPFKRYGVAVSAALLFLVTALVAIFVALPRWQRDGRRGSVPSPPFQQMEIKRVTANGKAKDAAISPDGRYIAYVMLNEGGKQSIHLHQVDTNSSVPIRPPANVSCGWPVFSPDGKTLYYYVSEEGRPRTLYRSDVLGGVPIKVLTDFSGPVTFSPDGKRLALRRQYEQRGETALVLANAQDGSGEQILAVRKFPAIFSSGGSSWSPDGQMIALGATDDYDRSGFKVFGVRVADGRVETISDYEWPEVNRVAWLGDGSGLVLTDGRLGEYTNGQLWHLSYPGGEARRITNDLHDYNDYALSLSADSRSLVTVQLQTTSNIWVLPEGDPARARQITFGPVGRYDGFYGLAWTPRGRIVYSSHVGDGQSIWVMDADGANARQLTPAGQVDNSPTLTTDGRYIVFQSNRGDSFEIWRMDADGSNVVQLTTGTDYYPSVSPDSRWVVYASIRGQQWALWKVSIDGGEPLRLTDKSARWPAVSPDGKWIACSYDGRAAVIPFEGGPPVKTFTLPRTAMISRGFRWTPDGQALIVRDAIQGLWRQQVAGGAPKHLTDFGPELIFNFAWSPDGKQLALARGMQSYDVVLLRDLRQAPTESGSN